MLRTENMLGALISYQSFFVNGSTLRARVKPREIIHRQSRRPETPRARVPVPPIRPSRRPPRSIARSSRRHKIHKYSTRISHTATTTTTTTSRRHRAFVVIARAHDQSPTTDPSRRSPSHRAHRDARRETRANELKHVRLLLAALLALGHSLILTDRHDDRQSRARERRTTSIADARRPVGFSVWCVRVSLYHSRMCLNTYYMSYYISHRDARVYYRVFDPVVWCMDRPCRYTHGGPPCAPSRSRPARARGPAHSRARGARDLDLDARTRRSFSVSLSRVRTRGIHAFRFVSCHFIRPRRRRSVAEWMRSDLSRAR